MKDHLGASRPTIPAFRTWAVAATLLAAGACSRGMDEHGHDPGQNGGIIVSVGPDHYHVEALFADGMLKLFTLDHDQTKVISVPEQKLTAYLRFPDRVDAVSVPLEPIPQPGDAKGQTSAFAGKVPDDALLDQVIVIVPSIQFAEERYRFSFMASPPEGAVRMPAKVTDEPERELYLTPGGLYTQSDIAANGGLTASQKYANFHSKHDMNPAAGTRVCPITGTRAHADCAWTIGGLEYQFCCPPCIDEFVKMAKENPDQVKAPDTYVKR